MTKGGIEARLVVERAGTLVPWRASAARSIATLALA
jgi:hypothetical protein